MARASVGAIDEIREEGEVLRLGLGVESGNVVEELVVVRVVRAEKAKSSLFQVGLSVGAYKLSPSPGTQYDKFRSVQGET